jgi:hypothetical protein
VAGVNQIGPVLSYANVPELISMQHATGSIPGWGIHFPGAGAQLGKNYNMEAEVGRTICFRSIFLLKHRKKVPILL